MTSVFRRLSSPVVLGVGVALMMPVTASAWYGGGWHGGGWHGEGWHGEGWGWHGGVNVGFYPYGGYGYDYWPYAAPTVIAPVVQTYVPPVTEVSQDPEPLPQQAATQSISYYCNNPQGTYPAVRACPSGWREVPTTPPDLNKNGK